LSSGADVNDNVVDGHAGSGDPVLVNISSNVKFLRNRVQDVSCGSCEASVRFQDVLNGEIGENEIEGSSNGGSFGDVISIRGASSNVLIRNNILDAFLGGAYLVFIRDTSTGVVIRDNNLADATGAYAITDSVSAAVNAERNWYGDPSGPNFEGGGPGTGNDIQDLLEPATMDFTPWLCKGTDTSPAIGFQPTGTTVGIDVSPCDVTPPVWSVIFKKHAMAPGSYVPGVPGPWSNRVVYMEFNCVDVGANQTGIAQKRGDLSVTFYDGVWTVANIPWAEGFLKGDAVDEQCIDKAGNVALPIATLGGNSIRVDTKAPICKAVPSTTWIPKGVVTANVDIDIDGSDATSGIASEFVTRTNSGGASSPLPTFIGVAPNRMVHFASITMPNNTAGKVTINVTLTDNAGNQAKCAQFYVRGN
jgi:hypothetical protein